MANNQNNSNSQAFQNISNEEYAAFSDIHGDQTARQCGSLGGEILKKLKEAYDNEILNKF